MGGRELLPFVRSERLAPVVLGARSWRWLLHKAAPEELLLGRGGRRQSGPGVTTSERNPRMTEAVADFGAHR
jgi:hypothetical protein